jgi:Carboxypeptidase regulatory-like domain
LKVGKLGWFVVGMALLAMPAAAAPKLSTISGCVRNSAGVPQMGAAVEIFSLNAQALTVFTDVHGFYSATDLLPGIYAIKVSAASFLPSLRENVNLRSGTNTVINLTLNTLFEAVQFKPRRGTAADDDDWKWTLRSMANRPILRLVGDDGPLVVVSKSDKAEDRVLKARVAFIGGSGSDGYGSTSDVSTAFSIERSIFTSGTVSLNGNVGYGNGSPDTVVRAGYSHTMADGSRPELALTIRRFNSPDNMIRNAALQALALSMSDTVNLADFIELNVGSELQTIQFMGRVNAFRPFGSADVHLSPNTVVEYRYATSLPNQREIKGFDTAPADLSESGPRMSISNNQAALERAHHHEISISQRVGNNNFQLAAYSDRISNTAVTGVGDVTAESGEVLPDVYSGTFTYRGTELNTNGLRLVAQRKLTSDITGTLDYSFGGVLDLPGGSEWSSLRDSLRTERRHAVTGKISGMIPHSKTRWIASYKWTSGQAITPVDMFNASPGQADPYFSIFLRQPLPCMPFFPGHLEALIDVRNLLAQGYVPVMGQDGHTLYLVQSARALRGGLAFTF